MQYVVNGAKKRKGQNYVNWTNTYRRSLKAGGKCIAPRVITSEWGNGDLLFSSFLFFHILYNESVFAFIII